jgi:ATP-dependent DNA helicase Q1
MSVNSNEGLSRELRESKRELQSINERLLSLQSRKRQLKAKIESLETQLNSRNDLLIDENKYNTKGFEWSLKIQQILENSFKLSSFRSYQLMAINATLSANDVILIMPTGGGKSLCFQLPALLEKGFYQLIHCFIYLLFIFSYILKNCNVFYEVF